VERAIYWVLEDSQGWIIRFKGDDFGPIASRASAVALAVRVAAKAHEHGLHAQVLIRIGERFRTIWVNGRNLLSRPG
jgi:hypothetical protein